MGCTPMTQRWRRRWRTAAAECASNICAAINKEKAFTLHKCKSLSACHVTVQSSSSSDDQPEMKWMSPDSISIAILSDKDITKSPSS